MHICGGKRQKACWKLTGNLHSTSFYCWPHKLQLPASYSCFDLRSCEFKFCQTYELWINQSHFCVHPSNRGAICSRPLRPGTSPSFIFPAAAAPPPSLWQSDKWGCFLWHISSCGEYTRYEGAVAPNAGALLEPLKVLAFPVGDRFQETARSRVRTEQWSASCVKDFEVFLPVKEK